MAAPSGGWRLVRILGPKNTGTNSWGITSMDVDLRLKAPERMALQRLVAHLGEASTLAQLAFSGATLARVLAGLPVRRATLVVVRNLLTASGTVQGVSS